MQKMIAVRILITSVCCLCHATLLLADSADACLAPGQWVRPTTAGAMPDSINHILAGARDAQFVLLGEAHDNPEHHLWQLQTLGMLLGQRDKLVIGMEMFPRRVQNVLDRWVAGELTESQLLDQSDWNRNWRFDPDLYLPILRFARLNRVPVVALNVERSLISETGANGWDAVETERREGVTDPAPASEAYRDRLRSSFQQHGERDESAFENFVQAQLIWDRAFAQALAAAAVSHPQALVVGIIGSGHLSYGHGVPHQLHSLGIEKVIVWLPKPVATACDELADIADAVFGMEDGERTSPPRLGIYLLDTDDGIEIRDVLPGSVAEKAGLASGDRIVAAAGVRVRRSDDVIALIRRQSPGTWLPLTITRDEQTLELVAKFPASAPATDAEDGK